MSIELDRCQAIVDSETAVVVTGVSQVPARI
jgi:hypothetical protein